METSADPIDVRLAYLIHSVLLFGFQLEAVDHALDEDAYEEAGQIYGKPVDQLVDQTAQVSYLLLERFDQLRLMVSK